MAFKQAQQITGEAQQAYVAKDPEEALECPEVKEAMLLLICQLSPVALAVRILACTMTQHCIAPSIYMNMCAYDYMTGFSPESTTFCKPCTELSGQIRPQAHRS